MTKKQQQDYKPYLIGGAVLLAYFGVIRPVFKKLGIVKGVESQKVENYEKQAPEKNPFNANYFAYWKRNYARRLDIEKYDAYKLMNYYYDTCKCFVKDDTLWKLNDMLGIFWDDEESIYGLLRDLFKDKLQLSYFSRYVFNKTGRDLFVFLKTGQNILPANGLNDAEMLQIIDWANKLPDYYGIKDWDVRGGGKYIKQQDENIN